MAELSTPIQGIEEPERSNDDPQPQRYGDPETSPGELLTLEPAAACKRALEIWKSQNKAMNPLECQWEANFSRRKGYTGLRILPRQDDASFYVRYPTDAMGNVRSPDAVQSMKEGSTLCRQMTGVLTADPPIADCLPGEGEEDDEEAAQFANRVLQDLDETGAEIQGLTSAIDKSHHFASVFRRYYWCQYAGKKVPVEVQAGYDPATGERATTVQDAEFRTRFIPPNQDEAQAAMMQGMAPPEPKPIQVAWPAFETRMVTEDGRLTDERKEAAMRYEGAIEAENLTGNNLRLIPWTCSGIHDAKGFQILSFSQTWGDLRAQFPELNDIGADERSKILSFKQKWAEPAYPPGQKKRYEEMMQSQNVDDRPCMTLTTYFTGLKCPDYPNGLYMVQLGDSYLLHRSTLSYTDEDEVEVPMMLPLAQVRLFTEGRDHPYGVALMEMIGPGGELRDSQVSAALDYLDKLLTAKTFVDVASTLQDDQLNDRSRRYVSCNLNSAGAVQPETVAPFPALGFEIFNLATEEMRRAAGLENLANLRAPDTTSGVQAMSLISAAQAALAPQARAVVDPYLRGARVRLELVKAHVSVPRQIKWSTEDGRYRRQAWSRSDLGNTSDVRLKAGTMSLMTPAAKTAFNVSLRNMGVLNQEEFEDVVEGNISGQVAVQTNPFRQRIRRQIADWKDGPPEGWQPPQPVMQNVPQQVPTLGGVITMNVPQQVTPPDPLLASIWAPVPSDTLPQVAQTRLSELAKLTATTEYQTKPAPWRVAVDQEFAKMQQVVQQAQAAQAAQQKPQQTEGKPKEGGMPGQHSNGAQAKQKQAADQSKNLPVETASGRVM